MLALTFSQLKQIYGQETPEIVEIADKSSTVEDFKAGMLRLLGDLQDRKRSCGGGEGANSTLTRL